MQTSTLNLVLLVLTVYEDDRRILDALCRLLAPVLCFTAEEIWQHLVSGGERGALPESVHLQEFPIRTPLA